MSMKQPIKNIKLIIYYIQILQILLLDLKMFKLILWGYKENIIY